MISLEELTENPHPALARIRPVGWVDALGGWVVASREHAMAVMRDPVTFTVDDPRFSTAQVVGPSMLSLDGAAHKAHRDPFESPFGLAETRRRFTPVVQQTVDDLIAAIQPTDGGPRPATVDLRRTVAGPLSVAVVAYSLGLPPASASTVLDWYTAISDSVTGVSAGRQVTPEGAEAFAQLHAHVALGIDSADSLIAAAARAGLGVDDVVANAAVLMFGGIETTEGMITNALWHLLNAPDQLDLVRADPTLLPNALEESLRLEPAAAVVDRYATRDVELAGASIHRGDLVTVSLAGAGRDPAVFPSPDTFDVRRTNARRHLAFASGPHICLGMHLTRLETQTAVSAILDLPGLRLDPASPPPHGLVFRKPPALNVSWDA
ncbi:pulcherriminic acid synthase [Kribbella steppae]|uniref:Pulcherriminic acid synthase n=1 Tax=Kribbella steppae TaxID=2512223 RepID=A0A4V2RZ09_9ACTN|nr:cytochrome P450 [Kribbella steppae]TCO23386.1 pulcherriminic acid synthase [Kribbella steppae]